MKGSDKRFKLVQFTVECRPQMTSSRTKRKRTDGKSNRVDFLMNCDSDSLAHRKHEKLKESQDRPDNDQDQTNDDESKVCIKTMHVNQNEIRTVVKSKIDDRFDTITKPS